MLTAIPDNFVYFGLNLINKDREKLIDIVNEMAPKQMIEATKFYIDHVTLLHRNDKHQFKFKFQMYCLLNYIFENFIGETYEVKVTHIGFNQKAMAFRVELPDCFPMFLYKTYHITICTFNNAKPVESNNIINWHKLYEPIIITTILTKTTHEKI